jgi:hypothetical protein
MSTYRIYYVTTGRPKMGKANAAGQWWAEKGLKQFEAVPGTKSVRAYVVQFGLSGDTFTLEIWQEIENYASFDLRDQFAESNIATYTAFHTDFLEYYDLGPSRIMGDWPASRPGVGVA